MYFIPIPDARLMCLQYYSSDKLAFNGAGAAKWHYDWNIARKTVMRGLRCIGLGLVPQDVCSA